MSNNVNTLYLWPTSIVYGLKITNAIIKENKKKLYKYKMAAKLAKKSSLIIAIRFT